MLNLTLIFSLVILVSLGLSISLFFIKKSNMKNLSTESSDYHDFCKSFIFSKYKDFLNKNLQISNINDLGVHLCVRQDDQLCHQARFNKWCNNLIIYNTNNQKLVYCFEDKYNIVHNYYTAQNNYNIAKTTLKQSYSATKKIPEGKDNFRKQDRCC